MNKKEKLEQNTPSQREKKVKRSKTEHVRSSAVSIPSVSIDCFLIEEHESCGSTSEDIHKSFKETSSGLRKIFQAILRAKQNKMGKREFSSPAVYTKEISMQIVKLKELNRLDKHRAKKSRDMVNEKKQKVDNLNLQYQNLLYEMTYVQREVTKCLEFRSQDEDIELISVEEFYEEAPKEISRLDITKHDNHELTLARLRWELEQRKRLAVQLKEAVFKKEACISSIKKLKERLDNIQPTLCGILEAAEPLQTVLGMPLQATQPMHKVARFLPKPLHVLYIEMCAYREACDKKIGVLVEGNVDDAKIFQLKMDDSVEDSGESDQDENVNITYHKRSMSGRQASMNDNILNKHPLSVSVVVVEKGTKIVVEFHYLIHLHIVTVSVKALSAESSSCIGDSKLNMNSFLDFLFPGDNGRQSPNPLNKFHLSRARYGETPFSSEETGFPYVWAQKLAGLHFISIEKSDCETSHGRFMSFSEISPIFVEQTILAIKSRLQARISLSAQISSLEQGSKLPVELATMYPVSIISQLKKWSVASWEDILNHPSHQEMLSLNIISRDAMMYKAVIERGSAVLTAVIFIFPDYPIRSPVFLLFLHWKTQSTAISNFALREMEEEINVHCIENLPDEHKHNSLSCQVHHLLACFDIFLETERSGESLEGPREFIREKVVTKIYRGCGHSRPYRYLSSKGIFTQR